MNKIIKSACFISCAIFLTLFVCGNENIEKSLEATLLRGMAIKYWIIDLDASLLGKDAWLYVDIETKNGILREQKLMAVSEISSNKLMAALQKQGNDYVLFVCDDTAFAVNCRIEKDMIDSPLLLFKPGKSLPLNTFMVKGDESRVVKDFSRLYNNEFGIKLKVKKDGSPSVCAVEYFEPLRSQAAIRHNRQRR